MMDPGASGPLTGVRVVEFAGLGPAPFCGMLLADMGAEVLLIDRADAPTPTPEAITLRGRCHLPLDLKREDGRAQCMAIMDRCDVLIEGFRPGVMERLGLGPEAALSRNPALIYGRMTGWGQYGPYSQMAGHDLNYIALSGALDAIGPADRPVPPLNLVGDFGGGALYLAMGILAALLERGKSGQGQVIDCAISDGTASLMALIFGFKAEGRWTLQREANRLDGGSPFYAPYRCADGKWITLAPLEDRFYAELLELLHLNELREFDRTDRAQWPEIRRVLTDRIASFNRDHWHELLAGTDVCFAPVLDMEEAADDMHNRVRETFVKREGVLQPAPAPRFSRTKGKIQTGSHGPAALLDLFDRWGVQS